jgi:putative membrane protein
MRHWDGSWAWGVWVTMGVLMLLFWGVVAWVVVALLGHGSATGLRGDDRRDTRSDPLRILDERFARGEIDADEYRQRRDTLAGRS